MRVIFPKELDDLKKEIEPYLVHSLSGVSFKEGTPDEIKKKFELWKTRCLEYYD